MKTIINVTLLSLAIASTGFAATFEVKNEEFRSAEMKMKICNEIHYELGDHETKEEDVREYCINQLEYTLTGQTTASSGELTIQHVQVKSDDGTCDVQLYRMFPQKNVDRKTGDVVVSQGGWEVAIANGDSWCF